MSVNLPGLMQRFSLEGRIALVTGSGSGLGRTFGEALSSAGAHVLCADRNMDWAQDTAGSIEAAGGTATPIEVDVSDSQSISHMAELLNNIADRVDILVNNAGISTRPARVHELEIEDWDRLMAVNLRGVFLTTRAIIPFMLAGGGSIVNVASIVGIVGAMPASPIVAASYPASKAGVIGFTKQVAVEYAGDGIRANAIAPGFHAGTRLAAERREHQTERENQDINTWISNSTPLGRFGQPEELQALVVYLASAASSFVTGQVFVHDGGWLAQ